MALSADLVVVGSGPASAFFLSGYLSRAPKNASVLVLERGRNHAHAQQLADRKERLLERAGEAAYTSQSRTGKHWIVGFGVGGASNLWWGNTPRLLPEDFEMKSRYGVGEDWPLTYQDLEQYYCEAEAMMQIAGEDAPFPRSRPLPLPAHRFQLPDQLLKEAYPDLFFALPSARASQRAAGRSPCCNSGVCGLCPVDAKFRVHKGPSQVLSDPRVRLLTEANVLSIETKAGVATGVHYLYEGKESHASGDLIALGANAIFNPYLLLRSGLPQGDVGRNLFEQQGVRATVDLDGVNSYQGGTSLTGHGYMLYSGSHRRDRGAALIETKNSQPQLRLTPGKWRQRLLLNIVVDVLPQRENLVAVDSQDPFRPIALHHTRDAYSERTIQALPSQLARVLSPLPVEQIRLSRPRRTEGHIMGTTRMGPDPNSSVVDAQLMHHTVRNLLVLGSGSFPTGSPANPTLTIAALSLRAAAALS